MTIYDRKPCLDCVRKHLAQAAVLRDEMFLGYPEHFDLAWEHLTVAEACVRDAVLRRWRLMGHLAEASDESVGEWPELASAIRDERLKFQEDPNYRPEFERLMLLATELGGGKLSD